MNLLCQIKKLACLPALLCRSGYAKAMQARRPKQGLETLQPIQHLKILISHNLEGNYQY
jgi:hypothetical protein